MLKVGSYEGQMRSMETHQGVMGLVRSRGAEA